MPRPLILRFDVDDRGAIKVKGIERSLKGMGRELDKTSRRSNVFARALGKLTGPIRSVTRALTSFKGLLVGAGITAGVLLFTKSVLGAASTVEQLKLQLEAVTGSTEAANRLFDEAAGFAKGVAFEYEEIIRAATQLQVALQSPAEETIENLKLAADLAATFGLTIEVATSQLVRGFSAGAGAMEIFREKGLLTALKFQQGVAISGEETRKKFIEEWKKAGSFFRGTAEEMGDTFAGIMSQLQDRWFQFRLIVADAGLFDATKNALSRLNEGLLLFLDKNESAITGFVERISSGIADVDIDGLIDRFRGLGFELSAAGDTGFAMRSFFGISIDNTHLWFLRLRIANREIEILRERLNKLIGADESGIPIALKRLGEELVALGPVIKALGEDPGDTPGLAVVREIQKFRIEGLQRQRDARREYVEETVKALRLDRLLAAQSRDLNRFSLIDPKGRAEGLEADRRDAIRRFARNRELASEAGGPMSVFPSEQVMAGFNNGISAAADATENLTAKAQKLTDVFKQAAQAASLDVKIIGLEERAGLVSRVDALKERFEIEQNLLRAEQDSLIAQGDAAETDKARLDINAKLFAIFNQMAFTVRAHDLELIIQINKEEKERTEEAKRVLKVIQDTAEAQEEARQKQLEEEQRHFEQRLDIAGNFFGSFGDLSRAAFEASGRDLKGFMIAYKALAIAAAIIDTYASAVAAYKSAAAIPLIGGISLAPIAAAAAIAAGLANVARIASVTFHRGGLIGGNENEPLIKAQRGEFIMQATAVERIGVPTLRRLNKGRDPAGEQTRAFIDDSVGAGMVSRAGGSGARGQVVAPVINKINVSIYDTKESFNTRLQDPDAEEIIVRIGRENEDTGGARANF